MERGKRGKKNNTSKIHNEGSTTREGKSKVVDRSLEKKNTSIAVPRKKVEKNTALAGKNGKKNQEKL